MSNTRAVDQAKAAAYLSLWQLVRRLPEPTAQSAFAAMSDRFYARNSPKVQRLRANLRRLVPEADLEAEVRLAVRSYLRYWCESFRLASWDMDDLVSRTRLVGEENLRTALDEGRGVVIPLPHTANWDWAGAWACQEVAPLMTVAERLQPERLYDEFVRFRESLGMHVLPLTGGQPPMARLQEWLRAGGLVCLLADRDLSSRGIRVDFLGEQSTVPPGPAVLSLRTGAPMVPVTLRYPDARTMEITFHSRVEPASVEEMSQQMADALAQGIRRAPHDWHMMQWLFTSDVAAYRAGRV